jgi:hypothetical protein
VRQGFDKNQRKAGYQAANRDDDRQALENVGSKFGQHLIVGISLHSVFGFLNPDLL